MHTIAIRSNKELYFPEGKGIITMKINFIQINPEVGTYTIRLEDSCTREVVEEDVIKTVSIGIPRIRFKTMTYEELDTLYESLNIDQLDLKMREKVDESFRQGLLLITQKECIDGISGEANKGQYYSEAEDWYILR